MHIEHGVNVCRVGVAVGVHRLGEYDLELLNPSCDINFSDMDCSINTWVGDIFGEPTRYDLIQNCGDPLVN